MATSSGLHVSRSDTSRTFVVDQHRLPLSVALHLLPGIVTAAVFYALAPTAVRTGYPAIAAALVAVGLVLVTAELGWLLREAHRRTGAWTVANVMPFRPGPFTRRKSLLVIGLIAWAFAVSALGIGSSIKDSFFSWMPAWALDPFTAGTQQTGTPATIVIVVAYVLLLVVLGPVVEELYFRGYLLPRIGRFGAWAPLINVSLFALYHLWKPWDVLNLILVLAPVVYAVWRLKDVRIGIAVHVSLNSLALMNVLPALLR